MSVYTNCGCQFKDTATESTFSTKYYALDITMGEQEKCEGRVFSIMVLKMQMRRGNETMQKGGDKHNNHHNDAHIKTKYRALIIFHSTRHQGL